MNYFEEDPIENQLYRKENKQCLLPIQKLFHSKMKDDRKFISYCANLDMHFFLSLFLFALIVHLNCQGGIRIVQGFWVEVVFIHVFEHVDIHCSESILIVQPINTRFWIGVSFTIHVDIHCQGQTSIIQTFINMHFEWWHFCRYSGMLIFWHIWIITKTYLYNFSPLKPHIYIIKLGFTGWFFLFLLGEAVLTSTHNLCFEQKYKNVRIFIWNLSVFGSEIFNIFE